MPATLRRYTLIVLILMSPVLSAAQASQAPLLAQELSTYRLLTLFHLLRLEQGSPDVQARLETEVQHFAGLLTAHPEALPAPLQQQAQHFQAVLLNNARLNYEAIDFYALDTLSQSAHDLLQLNRQQQALAPAASTTLDLRQAILMQQIAAEYVREAASFDSGSAVYDSAQERFEPVDVLAKAFRQRLEQLQPTLAGSAEQREKWGQVQVIWNFIEQPLLEYRERSLPFVVNRYSEQIVALLVN
ncbi:hypothetical protein [Pseudomonas peli]|uniref:hypothetical protein n=1 Tax=Pseudomonas peli TaxID=592361 RepID=UPI00285922C5|nr:hypothetical protein [Pseudomonas peli]MDR7023223.1 hypothetical protein [Pseudomonas peli]